MIKIKNSYPKCKKQEQKNKKNITKKFYYYNDMDGWMNLAVDGKTNIFFCYLKYHKNT